MVAICAPLVGLAAAWPAAKLDDARRTYDTADNAQRATTKSIIAQSDHPDKQYWGDTLVSSIADCKPCPPNPPESLLCGRWCYAVATLLGY